MISMQDNHPTLWYSENGQRVGTYNGHNGAVPSCDVTSEPFYLSFHSIPVLHNPTVLTIGTRICLGT